MSRLLLMEIFGKGTQIYDIYEYLKSLTTRIQLFGIDETMAGLVDDHIIKIVVSLIRESKTRKHFDKERRFNLSSPIGKNTYKAYIRLKRLMGDADDWELECAKLKRLDELKSLYEVYARYDLRDDKKTIQKFFGLKKMP